MNMETLRCVPTDDDDDDDGECEELLWVKAGEPGEKPTIIRQIRSESSTSSSSRDNSGGSSGCGTITRQNLLKVENGTVYRTNTTSSESINTLEKLKRTSSNDSRVIVVNVSQQIYPAQVDRQRIKRWKETHSPSFDKKFQTHTTERTSPNLNNNSHSLNRNKSSSYKIQKPKDNNQRPVSQPTRPCSSETPDIERCASSSSPFNRVKAIRSRDEGYTSLSEDCKDSDTESVRSKSLPSSWRPNYLNKQGTEKNMQKYAQRMTVSRANSPTEDPTQSLCFEPEDCTKADKNERIRHRLENIVEICTCFVCVRSAVYHAEDEDDTDSLVDHPCSCDQPGARCCGRWSVIGLMVLFLPLLIFYPPLKCCINIHSSRKRRKLRKKEKKRAENNPIRLDIL